MAADAAVNFNLLHRTCKLVVLLCFLHISVTIVFYIRSLDIRFAFVQNQQTYNHSTQSNQLRHPAVTSQVESQKPVKGWPQRSPEDKEEEPPKKLDKCPETSPLLGKSAGPVWLAWLAVDQQQQVDSPGCKQAEKRARARARASDMYL